MSSIYKIKPSGEFLEVEKAPFSDEIKELESFIMKNEKILGNVVLLNRQVTMPDGKRIDIWGLDTLDLCPVIVELKNVSSGIEVIPQVLPYYSFVKSNPDSLKFRAISDEKFMSKLASFEIDREKLDKILEEDPKVILVAPKFNKELLEVVDYFNIKFELVEISRYKTDAGETLITVNKPKLTEPVKGPVRVMEEWNWEKYKKVGISEKKIEVAKGLKEKIDNIIRNEKIPVEPIFRKLYIPYQSGRSNVFWIDLSYTSWTTGDIRLTFYLDKKPDLDAEGIVEHTKTKWEEEYNLWSIFFNKPVDLSALTPIIKKSYEYVTGQKLE